MICTFIRAVIGTGGFVVSNFSDNFLVFICYGGDFADSSHIFQRINADLHRTVIHDLLLDQADV